MSKPLARLEQWRFAMQNKCLSGTVYEHPVHSDGTILITAEIVSIDLENNIAETENTMYILGSMKGERHE